MPSFSDIFCTKTLGYKLINIVEISKTQFYFIL